MPDASGTVTRIMPIQVRLASFKPDTFNAETRTIELVWSTGADVTRYDWYNDRSYVERLRMTPEAVDLSRLNAGAALLNSHNWYDLSAQIGVVERAWLDNGEGRALVRFSSRDDVAPLLKDVQDGVIRNVSVGYDVSQYEITESRNEPPLYEAVNWTPLEISLVTVPADPSAGVRGAEDQKTGRACIFINRAAAQSTEEYPMPIANTTGGASATVQTDETRAADIAAARAEASRAERQRVTAIRAAGTSLGIAENVMQEMIDGDVTADAARARMIDLHAEASRAQRVTAPAQQQGASGDDPEVMGRAMAESIALRYGKVKEPSPQARSYSTHSIVDMASELLRANGVRVETRNKPEIIRMALAFKRGGLYTTGDFAGLLLDAANKMLLSDYNAKPQSYRQLAQRNDFADFKAHNFIRLGDFPSLVQVNEEGEFKSGRIKDNNEKVTAATYGRIIGLSRQALINDDLGAFAGLTAMIGRRAADFENATFYALLAQNSGAGPTMSDSVAQFHANHGNKAGTASAIDVPNVGLGYAAIQKQVGLVDAADKKTTGTKLNLAPRYIVCGPDRFLQAAQVATPVQPTQASNINPYSSLLSVVADANISGNIWYLFADPADAPAYIYGYLNGQEGPRIESKNGFEVDGIELKVALDFGVGAVDYKPGYFNAGA